MNSTTTKKELPIFMLCVTPESQSNESTLPNERGSESYSQLLETVEIVLMLREVLFLELIPTSDALYKLLQMQENCQLACCIKSSYKSFQCLKLDYSRPCSLSGMTTMDPI